MKKLTFLIMLAFLVGACNNSEKADKTTEVKKEATKPAKIQFAVFEVSGMHCNGCVGSVTTKLEELDGVIAAEVSLEEEQAIVEFDANILGQDDFKAAVEEVGYSVGEILIADELTIQEEAGEPEE